MEYNTQTYYDCFFSVTWAKRREKNPQLPGETRESRITLTPGILTNNPNTSRSPSSALFILLEELLKPGTP